MEHHHHKKDKSPEEEKNLQLWHENFSKNGEAFSYEKYKAFMLPIYESYFSILQEDPYLLKDRLRGQYEWYDYRSLFANKARNKTTYLDNIHTNLNGNKIIASSIAEDISSSKCMNW